MVFFQDMAYLLLDVPPPPSKRSRQDPATPIPPVSASHLPTTSAQTTQLPSQMPNDSLSSPRCNINRFICIIIKTLLRLQMMDPNCSGTVTYGFLSLHNNYYVI